MVQPAPTQKKLHVGFRFCPTDEELIACYLKHKLKADDPSIHDTIPEIDVCKYDPCDLPAFSAIKSDDLEWFFFSPSDYKYRNSTRRNRATPHGYWKVTGKGRKIKVPGTSNAIGTMKNLVFYEGRVTDGVKTNWVIHEYHNNTFPAHQRTHVLCRLIKKPKNKTEGRTYELVHDESEPSSHSSHMVSEDENPEEHCFSNVDSIIQTPSESFEPAELENSILQTPLNLDESLNSMFQTLHEFYELFIQAPHESYEPFDSTLLESHEYDLNLLLQQSPSVDEQELVETDSSLENDSSLSTLI